MESVFYYPLTLHQGTASGSVVAPWVTDLPSGSGVTTQVVVLTQNESLSDGMYLWDGTQWRLVIPYVAIAESIISGAAIEVFYQMAAPYTQLPINATLWKNSVQTQGTTVTAGTSSVWGAAYVSAAGTGTVQTVNNVGPDGSGNVEIEIANIPGLQTALDNAGSVKTVDGQSPDGNGNIVVEATTNPTGTNGLSPVFDGGASTGNIILRQIVGGTGITAAIDGNGNIDLSNAGVLSVNGETGAVTGIAPLASPAFTGTPTAPTPTIGDDSQNLATTAFVQTALANGVANSIQVFEYTATAGQTSFPASFPPGAVVEVFRAGIVLQSNEYATNNAGPVVLNLGANAGDPVKIVATSPFAAADTVPTSGGTFTGQVYGVTANPGDNSTQFATTAFVDNAIAGISAGVTSFNTRTGAVVPATGDYTVSQVTGAAPLASPAFTGTPTAPTATAGTNTTQVATTAFVTAAVAAGGSGVTSFNTRTGAVVPATGDYTVAQVTGAAPLASPALTGTPTAPTATAGTNTTQLATTAFVTAAVAAGTAGVSSFNTRTGAVVPATGDYTVAQVTGAAPIASPTFTGVPAAPTATAGTSTTQVATTAFVGAAITAGGFLTTASAASTYAPLASPALTGNPTAPTATAGTNTTQVATTAFVTTAVAGVTSGYAPLASPTFTGTPAAPTATAGTSTTQIATTAFVGAAITAGGFLTTASAASTYAPLASPALTGTPTAPTATAGTNTTQVATTAFVTAAVFAAGGSYAPLASPAFTGTPTVPTASSGTDTTQAASTAFVYNATQVSTAVPLTNANVTLSAAQYGSAILNFTGTLTGNVVITFPTTGQWTLNNATTGAFTVTVSNGSGATFTVPQSASLEVFSLGSTGMVPSSSSSPVRFQSPAYSYTVSALGSVSGTQTLNLGSATEFTMTITGATTLAFTNTLGTNQSEVVYIRFTNAGSAAITWPSGAQFAGGTAPTFTTSGIDLIGVKYDTTSSTYFVFVIGLNMLT